MGAGPSLGPIPYKSSFEVPGSAAPGFSPIRRSVLVTDELLTTAFPGEVTTLYEGFKRGLKVSKNLPCLGSRKITREVGPDGKVTNVAGDYVFFTYAEIAERIEHVGAGIHDLGLVPLNSTGIAPLTLFSKNRIEWLILEEVAKAWSGATPADVPETPTLVRPPHGKMVDCSLYDSLGDAAVMHILNETETPTVFADIGGVKKLLKMLNDPEFASKNVVIKNIVSFDPIDEVTEKLADSMNITLRTFVDLETHGKQLGKRYIHCPPLPDDLAFLCYTSGTTGNPKGVMISHKNMVCDASLALAHNLLDTSYQNFHLSFLPLSHVFERLFIAAMIMTGSAIGFSRGDTTLLMEDIKALRPTIFVAVPRLFNKIADKVTAGALSAGGLKKFFFLRSMASKKKNMRTKNTVKHSLWDPLVCSKLLGRVGLDRCKIIVSGSAPLAPHVMEFLRCAFAMIVIEGYGSTETSAASALCSIVDQASIGHVGGPASCCEIRLASVPEMNFSVEDTQHSDGTTVVGRGEVCIRGNNIFQGYYKQKEMTDAVLSEDGWYRTGDVGAFTPDGNLRIIDRVKNIFKLSQGEYVAAERIENVYCKSNFVAQMFVYGDSYHSCIVAVVVPDEDYTKMWAKEHAKHLVDSPLSEIIKVPEFREAVKIDMDVQATAAKLFSFEKVKNAFIFEPNPWTVDDILTPSFKLKRADGKIKYMDRFNALYEQLGDTIAGEKITH